MSREFEQYRASFPKPRACFHCRTPFEAQEMVHIYCSPECRIAWRKANMEKPNCATGAYASLAVRRAKKGLVNR